ncbi:MAG TPA: nucleoside transporter C-terminal domain-containing protein [Xanthobacteraceae bacterium]|nr:nucleoside transporter C-terminal domain-containing protein [Xanthobacteraceae bacterium]
MQSLQSALGVIAIIGLAFATSENRGAVNWPQAGIGLGVTVALALVMLKVPKAEVAFAAINDGVNAIATATRAGTAFVFGYVGGGPLPFEVKEPTATFILGFQALPVVLVMSVLSSLLFYWRIMPPIVRGFSWALERTLNVGGAVGLSTAANIFVGQVEAPLFIRPYLVKLSRGEMFVVMTGGMAGIAGTVFVLYATILANAIPNAAGHIVVCSVLGAPAAILISLIMVPDTKRAHIGGVLADLEVEQVATSTMDAVVKGTGAGLELLLNIVAMLIVFVALVHLANAVLGLLPDLYGAPVTLQRLLGFVMAPVCWLMGIPWSEAVTAGGLMGIKTILNELIAYLQLAALPDGALSPRSRLIMLYAMCGFANFGSLGIMMAGLSTMCPEKRDEVVSLGLKSIVSGTLTTCLLGAIVGMLTPGIG